MTIALLIQQYGYAALFLGAFIEGETVLVLAGFAAHRGYLSLDAVIAVASIAGFLGDQLYFLIGRAFGPRLAARFPAIHAARARLDRLFGGREIALAFMVRFLYGVRIAGPVAMGMSQVSALRFAAGNFAGALVWASAFCAFGYVWGQAFEQLLGRAAHYETLTAALIVLGGGIAWLVSRWRARRKPA
ncbi:MAG: DedA family protein [Burkholderiales bacterium]